MEAVPEKGPAQAALVVLRPGEHERQQSHVPFVGQGPHPTGQLRRPVGIAFQVLAPVPDERSGPPLSEIDQAVHDLMTDVPDSGLQLDLFLQFRDRPAERIRLGGKAVVHRSERLAPQERARHVFRISCQGESSLALEPGIARQKIGPASGIGFGHVFNLIRTVPLTVSPVSWADYNAFYP
jgi:hypothetical protein